MISEQQHFLFGIVGKKFSFKGEVLIRILFTEVNLLKKLEQISINIDGKLVPFFIERKSMHKAPNVARLKLKGIDHEDDTIAITQREIYLSLDILPPKKGRDFYHHEVIGFEAYDTADNKMIGLVLEINNATAQTLFVIQKTNKQTCYIPLTLDFISKIDRTQQYIYFTLPEGLLDL